MNKNDFTLITEADLIEINGGSGLSYQLGRIVGTAYAWFSYGTRHICDANQTVTIINKKK